MTALLKKILGRPLIWLISALLLPACWAAALSFFRVFPSAFLSGAPIAGLPAPAPEGWTFLAGAAIYAVWHRLRPPEFLYTFAHEFTHLAFGLLTGKKVNSFEVNRGGGKVGLSGTNPIVTLAPYFFPLLTMGTLVLGTLIGWAFGDERIRWATAFLAGLTLCLHVLMTFRALRTAQPDIARGGRIFSWAFIFFWGMVFIGGAALVSAGGWGAAASYLRAIWHESGEAYAFALGWMGRILRDWNPGAWLR